MKSKTKIRLLIGSLFMLVSFALVGSITGTLSWYVYSTSLRISYSGTSVAATEQLQIGIRTNDSDISDHLESYGLTKEVINSTVYSWADAGSGITSSALGAYLTAAGYASDSLTPVTSSKYSTGDNLSLLNAPYAFDDFNPINYAPTSKYSVIPLCFRVINIGDTNDETRFRQGETVWISNAVASSSDGAINESLRVYVNGASKYIFNPSETADGKTAVAGLLDLNADGYYDSYNEKEIVYGEYSGAGTTTHIDEDTELVDINNIGADGDTPNNTFYAKHHSGHDIYENYDGFTFAEQVYLGSNSVYPTETNGVLSGGKPLCVTASNANAIGVAELTVWSEGWDNSIIDSEINHLFNLGLQFQVSRSN